MSMTAVHLNHRHAGLGFIGIVISAHVGAMYILVPVFGVLTDRLSAVATITMRHGAHSPCLRDRRGSAARSEHGAGGDHAAGHWLVRHPRGILGSARRRVAHQFLRQLPGPFRLGHEHLWRCRRTAGWAHRQCDGPRVSSRQQSESLLLSRSRSRSCSFPVRAGERPSRPSRSLARGIRRDAAPVVRPRLGRTYS